jgi:hypothetical protein
MGPLCLDMGVVIVPAIIVAALIGCGVAALVQRFIR